MKSKFARTGVVLRVPTIDPNAMYLRREAKHLLRGIGDDALKELVDSGKLRKIDIGNRQAFRGQWILDFVEERGKEFPGNPHVVSKSGSTPDGNVDDPNRD